MSCITRTPWRLLSETGRRYTKSLLKTTIQEATWLFAYLFPKKHSYFVVLTILRAFRLHSKPELFHHDNGGEYDNGVVSRLLQMLGIVDVPTEVENPKGNGKKERKKELIAKTEYISMRNTSFRI